MVGDSRTMWNSPTLTQVLYNFVHLRQDSSRNNIVHPDLRSICLISRVVAFGYRFVCFLCLCTMSLVGEIF